MPVRTRLILTILAIAAALAVPALYALKQLSKLHEIAERQRDRHGAALVAIGQTRAAMSELDRHARAFISFPDTLNIAQDYRDVEIALDAVRPRVDSLDAAGYKLHAAKIDSRVDTIENRMSHIVELFQSGQREETTEYFNEVKLNMDSVSATLDNAARAVDSNAAVDIRESSGISTNALGFMVGALVVALGVTFVLGYWTTHSVTTPLRRLRRSMARVAADSYVVPEDLPYQRRDEIGDLSRSFSWMTQHLARLDKMKAEFISIATHELKTPINVITGYTELVDEGLYGELTPDQRQALHAIREQAQGLTRLVNQLLDVSRLEAGGLQLAMNEVIVEDLMEDLERNFSILAQKKDIRLTFSIGHNLPRSIRADPDRLRDQVLGNLLTNALKFTPEGGHVSVRTWGDGPTLHIEVSDTGVGIASDQLPYVFDKYYQVGQHARSKGAGLGLAIAREIIDAHGGTISVESTENVGTTFRIELPVRRFEPEVEGIPAGAGADRSES